MPRSSRLIIPGVAIHVIQRGNDRQACFRHETDFMVYLSNLRDLATRLGCEVHAYCLMTNHVHLLLTPPSRGACVTLMRDLGQRYVQYFNRRYARTGTLWEGRYRSCLTDSPRYVLACYRYIELNPVRAGMVADPRDYAWSSYAVSVGHRHAQWITEHSEFAALGVDAAARRAAYRMLIRSASDDALIEQIRQATNGGYPLCGDPLKAKLMSEGCKLEPGKPGPRTRQKVELNSGSDPELFSGGAAS